MGDPGLTWGSAQHSHVTLAGGPPCAPPTRCQEQPLHQDHPKHCHLSSGGQNQPRLRTAARDPQCRQGVTQRQLSKSSTSALTCTNSAMEMPFPPHTFGTRKEGKTPTPSNVYVPVWTQEFKHLPKHISEAQKSSWDWADGGPCHQDEVRCVLGCVLRASERVVYT